MSDLHRHCTPGTCRHPVSQVSRHRLLGASLLGHRLLWTCDERDRLWAARDAHREAVRECPVGGYPPEGGTS